MANICIVVEHDFKIVNLSACTYTHNADWNRNESRVMYISNSCEVKRKIFVDKKCLWITIVNVSRQNICNSLSDELGSLPSLSIIE